MAFIYFKAYILIVNFVLTWLVSLSLNKDIWFMIMAASWNVYNLRLWINLLLWGTFLVLFTSLKTKTSLKMYNISLMPHIKVEWVALFCREVSGSNFHISLAIPAAAFHSIPQPHQENGGIVVFRFSCWLQSKWWPYFVFSHCLVCSIFPMFWTNVLPPSSSSFSHFRWTYKYPLIFNMCHCFRIM
jgi:hypothetical protein